MVVPMLITKPFHVSMFLADMWCDMLTAVSITVHVDSPELHEKRDEAPFLIVHIKMMEEAV